MGTVAESIDTIREIVRDVEERVFSDAQLLRLYNKARRRLIRETELLVRGTILGVPPRKSYGVTRYWENSFTSESWWLPFLIAMDGTACTQWWEVEMIGDQIPQLSGGDFVTSPFELSFVEGVGRTEFQLPTDCSRLLWMGFEGRELEQKSNKWLAKYDPSFRSRQGDPLFFVLSPPGNRGFVPYPIPVTASSTSVMVEQIDIEEDEEAIVKEGFSLFYVSLPSDISSASETDSIPRGFVKYIEFKAAESALLSETELSDPKKASFLKQRYAFGLSLITRLKEELKRDVQLDKRMLGSGARIGAIGRPRFPEHYPPAWR